MLSVRQNLVSESSACWVLSEDVNSGEEHLQPTKTTVFPKGYLNLQ